MHLQTKILTPSNWWWCFWSLILTLMQTQRSQRELWRCSTSLTSFSTHQERTPENWDCVYPGSEDLLFLMGKWWIKDSVLQFKGIVLHKNENYNCWHVKSGSHEWPGENWQDILCSVKGRMQREACWSLCRKLLNKSNPKLYFFPIRFFVVVVISLFCLLEGGWIRNFLYFLPLMWL